MPKIQKENQQTAQIARPVKNTKLKCTWWPVEICRLNPNHYTYVHYGQRRPVFQYKSWRPWCINDLDIENSKTKIQQTTAFERFHYIATKTTSKHREKHKT